MRQVVQDNTHTMPDRQARYSHVAAWEAAAAWRQGGSTGGMHSVCGCMQAPTEARGASGMPPDPWCIASACSHRQKPPATG